MRRVTPCLYESSRFCTIAGQEFYRHTDTLVEVEPETLRNTLADVMTKALIDASADTLAEVKTEKLGDTSTNVKDEKLLHTQADTVTEVQAAKL